ncbi:DUF4197 domain-containing protein [Desertibaculum subflavum]|uniref:DUF4197 domain-containing protein n=1 Tax=Desertibaculum subflavum TaxID=2268458 RepID=UPI000E66CBDB
MRILLPISLSLLLVTGAALAQGSLLDQGKRLMEGGGAGGAKSSGGSLSQGQIGDGLREALKVGTDRTVGRVGRADGFLADQAIRIKPPGLVQKAAPALKLAGYGNLVDDLELKMNRAAEKAAPLAKDIFADAISKMTIDDARQILDGPQDAATQYLRKTSSDPLYKAMRPIIDDQLTDVGAVKALDNLVQRGSGLPGTGSLGFDLGDHVTDKALDGLFLYIAKEEEAIRRNPAARTTDLLKTVFK